MKSAIAGFSLGLLMLLLSSVASGQAVTAQERITEEIIEPNGKVIESHIREGVYYRTSAGSTLEQLTTIDGNATVGQMAWAQLYDKQQDVHYSLDYTVHHAYVDSMPNVTIPRNLTSRTRAQNALGQDSVQGIACTWFPTYLLGSDGAASLIGRHCISEKYNLILKKDVTIPLSAGQSAHKVTEMYSIQIGQEPDPTLFDVQHNFTIYRPDAAEQSPGTQQVIH